MCRWWQVGCRTDEIIDDAVASGVQKFVQALADGCKVALEYVSTFWLKVPDPVIAKGSGQEWEAAPTLASMQGFLMPAAAAIAVVAMAATLLKIAMSPERAEDGLKTILRQLVAVVVSTLPAMAIAQVLIEFGDQFSPWIISQGADMPASKAFQVILMGRIFGTSDAGQFGAIAIGSHGLGLLLVIFLLGIIGSLAQCVFMVIRAAALMVLFVILPAVGAGAGTEEGWLRYKRLLMIILGFVLYKPVAAVIYATGLRLLSAQGDDMVRNSVYGLMIMIMGAVALPAFIKFLLPAAAVGSSSAFSGGAAIGAVAAGAAVVALAGSGGTAAAGAAAGGAKPGSATGAGAGGASGSDGAGGPSGGPGANGGGNPAEGASSPSGSGAAGEGGPTGGGSSNSPEGGASSGGHSPSSSGSSGASDDASPGETRSVNGGSESTGSAGSTGSPKDQSRATSSSAGSGSSADSSSGGSSGDRSGSGGSPSSAGSGASAGSQPDADPGEPSSAADGSDSGSGSGIGPDSAPLSGDPGQPGGRHAADGASSRSRGPQLVTELARHADQQVKTAGTEAAEGAEE